MWTLWQDLRYSARLLAKQPGFTLTAIGVLTLGIGVNAGIFGIINGLMIRPLVGADAPGEVVGLYSKDRTTERGYRSFSYPEFVDVREAGGPFAHLAAHNVALGGVTENNSTRQAFVDIVTTGYFDALGVRPIYGRDFTIDEERPGGARSVIISYKRWADSGFDRDILKQTVRINGQDFAIVGVAPERFTGTTAMIGMELFVPLGVHDAIENDFDSDARYPISDRRSRPLIAIGRLKPEITREQADAQLKVIAAAHEQAYPDDNKNQDLIVRKLGRMGISTSPQDDTQLWAPMSLLQGLAAAVLLTSCLNLANMMLAFGSARQKEIAIRLAVGGARSRIVRQLLVQGLMLSIAGGLLGLLTSTWAARLLVSSMATVLPISLAIDLRPDMTVLFATMAFCTFATLAFGLWPALRLSRPDLLSSLKDQAGEVSGRIAGRITVRGALVTAQLALSLALLVLSGLFVRGAAAGASADPGFNLDPLVLAQVEPKLGGYGAVQGREAHRAVLARLRSTPGIESVAEASAIPFGDYSFGAAVQREGPRLKNEDPDAKAKIVHANTYTVTSDYFRTLGLTMIGGREFTVSEESAAGGTQPVIIDVGLAARLFANENPIGQLLQYGADSGTPESKPMLIVGVAPGVKHDLFENRPEPHIYVPAGVTDATRMFVYARAAAPQTADNIVTTVREQLRAADPNLPVMFVKSFRSQHEASAQVWILRAAAKMFLTLGLAAAFVAVIGLYGVRSYLVSRRTREFGVRMAVGASPLDVLMLVLRESITTTAVGLTIGLGLGMMLGWGLSFLIYQVSPFDPVTLLGATGLLAVSSIVASVVPARRAASVMPMAALRND
jgi:putative ABC transport system permease protein